MKRFYPGGRSGLLVTMPTLTTQLSPTAQKVWRGEVCVCVRLFTHLSACDKVGKWEGVRGREWGGMTQGSEGVNV